jgi:hypothetical protein
MDDKSDYYKEQALKSMVFSYSIKKGKAKEKLTLDNTDLRFHNYKHHKLPITMNPLEYGLLIRKKDNEYTIQISDTNLAIIIQYDKFNEVEIYRKGEIIYKYKDHKIDDPTFVRYLDNKQFTFKNNELILLTIDKSTKFINPLNLDNKLNNKFISFDIETYVNKDGIMIPFVIS